MQLVLTVVRQSTDSASRGLQSVLLLNGTEDRHQTDILRLRVVHTHTHTRARARAHAVRYCAQMVKIQEAFYHLSAATRSTACVNVTIEIQ